MLTLLACDRTACDRGDIALDRVITDLGVITDSLGFRGSFGLCKAESQGQTQSRPVKVKLSLRPSRVRAG